MSLLSVLPIAASGMASEGERLTAVASNLANANSVATSTGQPYRAREVVFQAVSARDARQPTASVGMAGVRVAATVESPMSTRKIYNPGSPFANPSGYVEMPNVDPVEEMVNMISAQQDYQANLEAFNVAKTMALHTLSI